MINPGVLADVSQKLNILGLTINPSLSQVSLMPPNLQNQHFPAGPRWLGLLPLTEQP